MKVVILAGGLGTRLVEETDVRPKPMVEIGGHPILWHIMKHYARYGHRDFFVACGYKGEIIKRYFVEYRNLQGDVSVDLGTGHISAHGNDDDWRVHLVDTGFNSNTGGRVGRLKSLLKDGPFMVTYGDGVCDVDIDALLRFHEGHKRIATLTAVRPPARFGRLDFDGSRVARFAEKPQAGEGWINGGFLVFQPQVFDHLKGDHSSLEADVLEGLSKLGELYAYKHEGFWQCMDTLRDKRFLEAEWATGSAPWKTWS